MKLLSQFETKGNVELLSQNKIALFSSKNTPDEIYKPAEELFFTLCKLSISLAGGWQAPLEKSLLDLTLSGMKANIIYYSAKDLVSIENPKLKELESQNKILYVSAQSRKSRVSKEDINKRDELMFKQVEAVLFLYIEPNGRLEKYFDQLINKKFPVYVLEHELNSSLSKFGAVSLNLENLKDLIIP